MSTIGKRQHVMIPRHVRNAAKQRANHLFEGYDYEEISQITGIKENTIRSLYMRGRQKLAAAVRQMKS